MENVKIVILDGFTENPGDISWDPIASQGDLTVYDRTSYDPNDVSLTIERAKDAEVIYTNKTPINKEVIDALPDLKFIGVLATGYNVVDIAYAKEKGILVSNIPAYGTPAVSQFAAALLLEVCHHVGEHSRAVHNGDWEKNPDFCFWNYPLIELAGKTAGVIGFGRIGQSFAGIAQAFGMNVIAHDIIEYSEFTGDTLKFASLDTLFEEADIISLHCPLTPENAGIINKDNIAKMKDGVIIINTSRGPLVNEADLTEALNSGKVGYAAVDVVSAEPIKADNPLLKAKNMIITPHIAWAPKEARVRLMDIAADNLKHYLAGDPINIVNS